MTEQNIQNLQFFGIYYLVCFILHLIISKRLHKIVTWGDLSLAFFACWIFIPLFFFLEITHSSFWKKKLF